MFGASDLVPSKIINLQHLGTLERETLRPVVRPATNAESPPTIKDGLCTLFFKRLSLFTQQGVGAWVFSELGKRCEEEAPHLSYVIASTN